MCRMQHVYMQLLYNAVQLYVTTIIHIAAYDRTTLYNAMQRYITTMYIQIYIQSITQL